MQLFELIHQLKRVEETLGWRIPVYVRSTCGDEMELFAIVPEKNDAGEYMLVLE